MHTEITFLMNPKNSILQFRQQHWRAVIKIAFEEWQNDLFTLYCLEQISLKKLRDCILRIIRVWSLFFSIPVYMDLYFLPFFWKTNVLSFFGFWVFVWLCNICIINHCNVICSLFSLYKNYLLKKTCYKDLIVTHSKKHASRVCSKNFIYKEKCEVTKWKLKKTQL